MHMFPFGKLSSKSKPNITAAKGCALAVGITLLSSMAPQDAKAFDLSKILSPNGLTSASLDVSTSSSGRIRFDAGDFRGSYRMRDSGTPDVEVRAGRTSARFSESKNEVRVGGHRIPAPNLKTLTTQPERAAEWQQEAIKFYSLNAAEAQGLKQVVRFAPTVEKTLQIQGALAAPASLATPGFSR
jgi:hypothetical protein